MTVEEVTLNIKGRRLSVGYIDYNTKTFTSVRRRDKHFYRNSKSWGMDTGILLNLKEKGIKEIRIFDQQTGRTYRTKLDAFFADGRDIDLGYGKQKLLPESYFEII
ncbi:hypothetical protein MTAT_19190 [Moorella thermoacetica]|uniref:Uncharacterized protein n=1 Tax=Neomoorella thermoacetica TaxID=1525 RepID=A0AAC9HK57_NEOTH|nr:hypothetical protein [Moorella thermoacetica]AOQ24576.1 hypothetical protein Maut_02146 [Moorella thermoacetica]TYL12677.1 hypothetical protein MTAT_19190 [Moorella thermoacetica]